MQDVTDTTDADTGVADPVARGPLARWALAHWVWGRARAACGVPSVVVPQALVPEAPHELGDPAAVAGPPPGDGPGSLYASGSGAAPPMPEGGLRPGVGVWFERFRCGRPTIWHRGIVTGREAASGLWHILSVDEPHVEVFRPAGALVRRYAGELAPGVDLCREGRAR